MRVLEFVCVYWNLYACIGICMRVLEFVCVFVPMGHRTFLTATTTKNMGDKYNPMSPLPRYVDHFENYYKYK